jgi:hypothetical protein
LPHDEDIRTAGVLCWSLLLVAEFTPSGRNRSILARSANG